MKAVKFPQQNIEIGKNQEKYNNLPAFIGNDEKEMVVSCFELTEAEIKQINETKRIWHRQLTFKSPMQPVLLSTESPFGCEGCKCEFDDEVCPYCNYSTVTPVDVEGETIQELQCKLGHWGE